MKKYILFGAGNFGKMALDEYGADNVECFADNNPAKHGEEIYGKKIISFEQLLEIARDFQIVISVNNTRPIAAQLREHGIFDYRIYSPAYRKLAACLTARLAAQDIRGIALYGTEDAEELVCVLREIHMDHLLKCVVVPAEEAADPQIVLGCPVCDLQTAPEEIDCYIVASHEHHAALRVQLQQRVPQSQLLDPFRQSAYYDTEQVVFKQSSDQGNTEEDWNQFVESDGAKEAVRAYVEAAKAQPPLFEFVEIETINRCNGVCMFCPVNKKIDPRPETLMDRELFERIIGQLEALDYAGELALFSNNEPLLDERIIDLHKYAREHLPKARLHMFTNGTLLTIPKFVELMRYLDELIIDNYQQELRLIKPSREIQAYVEEHPELRKKVTIVLRKPNEVLTSRGGDAPNRKVLVSYGAETCALPFQQMIIRPDGKVSLCCNDPLGKCTLGDLTKQTLLEVWYGPQFQEARRCLAEGRKSLKHCEFCDTFYVY